jgi:cytochrome c-type biogenesis protein
LEDPVLEVGVLRIILDGREHLPLVGGVLIIVFGLYLLGLFNVSAFARERRVHLADKPAGYLGTVLVGIAFGAGWTPCIGPILGAILTYNMADPDLGRGTALLGAYSLGLAVPFVLSALLLERFFGFFTRIRGKLLVLSRASGVLLVLVGTLMLTNQFTRLATRLQSLTPDVIRDRI